MTPQEQTEFNEMKRELAELKSILSVKGNRVVIHKTVIVDGILNADRVYTQRTGSYAELTT